MNLRSLNARHIGLISRHAALHSIRSGGGLVFLFVTLVFGIVVASIILAPVEMMGHAATLEGRAMTRDQAVAEMLTSLRPIVRWALGGKIQLQPPPEAGESHGPTPQAPPPSEPAAPQTSSDPYARWAAFLLDDRPAVLSAIFLILMFGVPLLIPMVAFNQISGDAQGRGLRYLLLRTERGNIFFGRFLGTAVFAVLVMAFLVAVTTFYLGVRIRIYPPGPLVWWALHGVAALAAITLPYVALCSWLSASIDSPFFSLVSTGLVIGGLPLAAWVASFKWKYAAELKYALPWGIQNHLLHPDLSHSLGAAAACIGYTLVFLALGYWYFESRDL